MIDASADQDYAAFERLQEQAQAAARNGEAQERRAHRTFSDFAAARPAAAAPGVLEVRDVAAQSEATAGTAEPPREPADALASLRVARLGFAAAVVLAIVAIWTRKRR